MLKFVLVFLTIVLGAIASMPAQTSGGTTGVATTAPATTTVATTTAATTTAATAIKVTTAATTTAATTTVAPTTFPIVTDPTKLNTPSCYYIDGAFVVQIVVGGKRNFME